MSSTVDPNAFSGHRFDATHDAGMTPCLSSLNVLVVRHSRVMAAEGKAQMTIRVYRIGEGGTRSPITSAEVTKGENVAPIFSPRFPQCECPRCRVR